MAIDPVCKMEVDEATTELVSESHGRKYYFCGPGCKAAFDKDPEKYLTHEDHQHHDHQH